MLPELFNLSGKVALITGGSKGLGKAMARGLAEAGADIVIASRHENELKPALAEILKGTDRKGAYLVPAVRVRRHRRARPAPDRDLRAWLGLSAEHHARLSGVLP